MTEEEEEIEWAARLYTEGKSRDAIAWKLSEAEASVRKALRGRES